MKNQFFGKAKRCFAFLLSSVIALMAYAEEGYSTCKVSEGEYAEATAYVNISGKGDLSGNLVISNFASRPLQTASIRVTVYYSWKEKENQDYEGEVEVSRNSDTTIYNSRWTGNIAGYQSGSIPLSGRANIPYGGYGAKITSIDVSISNPVCR